MSRIGKKPVALPTGTTLTSQDGVVTVSGKLGTLTHTLPAGVVVAVEGQKVQVSFSQPITEELKKFWGLTRTILANMIKGVTEGYQESLQIEGVGYKFELAGKKITLSVGYSHKVIKEAPAGITIEPDAKDKNVIHLKGFDKQLVGQFAAELRSTKKPEPYKGKGVRYFGEKIRRKAGKTAAK